MKLAAASLMCAAMSAHVVSAQVCTVATVTDASRWNGVDASGAGVHECAAANLASCEFDACAAEGNAAVVGKLRLNQIPLAGTIPSSVGALADGLTELHLWQNALTGAIPSEIGLLTDATGIYLDSNSLTGQIPDEIGDLTEVTWLAMHYNQLSGTVPESITNNRNLKYLFLDNNHLTGPLPQAIGSLQGLSKLAIWENEMSGSIPRSFAKMSNLQYFTISSNEKFSGFPLREEFCPILDRVACSLTDIVYTACPNTCASRVEGPGHPAGQTITAATDCGATCAVKCDYPVGWDWDPCDPNDPAEWTTYNPCKELYCEEVDFADNVNVGGDEWTADAAYELVVLKSGCGSDRAHHPHENVASGAVLQHWSGNAIQSVFTCVTASTPTACAGEWGPWSGCTESCDGGQRVRHYSVTTPATFGGAECPASDGQSETSGCNTDACPDVDCVGAFVEGPCSATCGTGSRTDTFVVSTPADGGAACAFANGAEATNDCNTDACPDVDCVGAFVEGLCSATCGIGERTDIFVVSTPANGGAECAFANGDSAVNACNIARCLPVNCVGDYVNGSACSASCDGGQRVDTFIVTTPASLGGAECTAANGDNRTEDCNTEACPEACPVEDCVGSWQPGTCSATCEGSLVETYAVTSDALNGGAACEAADGDTRTVDCNSDACPVVTCTMTVDATVTGVFVDGADLTSLLVCEANDGDDDCDDDDDRRALRVADDDSGEAKLGDIVASARRPLGRSLLTSRQSMNRRALGKKKKKKSSEIVEEEEQIVAASWGWLFGGKKKKKSSSSNKKKKKKNDDDDDDDSDLCTFQFADTSLTGEQILALGAVHTGKSGKACASAGFRLECESTAAASAWNNAADETTFQTVSAATAFGDDTWAATGFDDSAWNVAEVVHEPSALCDLSEATNVWASGCEDNAYFRASVSTAC